MSTKTILEELNRKYNGDFDTAPGAPTVTWADQRLAEVCASQQIDIDRTQELLEKAYVQMGRLADLIGEQQKQIAMLKITAHGHAGVQRP